MNNQWLKYLGLSMQLLVYIAVAVWGGVQLDKKWHISPALTIALPILILTICFYTLIKKLNAKK